MEKMKDLISQAVKLNDSLVVKINSYEQKERNLLRKENELAKKSDELKALETDIAAREKKVSGLEDIDKIKADSKTAAKEAKAQSVANSKDHEKQLKDIAEQRKFLNEDIARQEAAIKKLDGEKKALKEGADRLEKDKKTYKDKILEEFKKKLK